MAKTGMEYIPGRSFSPKASEKCLLRIYDHAGHVRSCPCQDCLFEGMKHPMCLDILH